MMTKDMASSYPVIGDLKYQEKVVQALFQDYEYAEQIYDVIKPDFFDQKYLTEIVRVVSDYKNKYNTFPSPDVVEDIMKRDEANDIIRSQASIFFTRVKESPLNGDMGYIQETSIDFCRRQTMKGAIEKALVRIEDNSFDDVWKIITDAANKGATRDIGHDYLGGFQYRTEKSIRDPMPTPWPVLNNIFGGGWEKKSLVTFIAPTGAGKTHFLVNVSAAGIAAGYNVVYISLEIADFKIGLRHDAYFSGVNINDVPEEMDRVKQEVESSVKAGQLFIKEFPTKGASVQSIRAYLQRLKTIKNFTPDIVVVDYAALLRAPRVGDKSYHDLGSVYEELRGMAQELNILLVTADQTNRSGLNAEIVSLESIADEYARATVCDLIMTVSRTMEDKTSNTGRIFIAKSRFGVDGIVYPFVLDPAKVKVTIHDSVNTPSEVFQTSEEDKKKKIAMRFKELQGRQ